MLLVACRPNTNSTILRTVVTVVQIHISRHPHRHVPAMRVDVTQTDLLQQLIVKHAADLLQQLTADHSSCGCGGVIMDGSERPVLGGNYRQSMEADRHFYGGGFVILNIFTTHLYYQSRHQLLSKTNCKTD